MRGEKNRSASSDVEADKKRRDRKTETSGRTWERKTRDGQVRRRRILRKSGSSSTTVQCIDVENNSHARGKR